MYINIETKMNIQNVSIVYIYRTTVGSICVGSAWKILPIIARSLCSLYIKANMVVYVCVQKLGSAWKIFPIITRSLWSW